MLIKSINQLSRVVDPELIHRITMKGIKFYPYHKDLYSPVTSEALRWNNKIGLAAGFDKNGEYVESLEKIGFGALEIGTVTPLAQEGNPRPRIEKLHSTKSIRNWMGFPGSGMRAVRKNLEKANYIIPLGINIGKNKDTPNDKAIEDYLKVALYLKDFASYFVINISSPNTAGLRELQNKEFISSVFTEFKKENLTLPFIKLSPDLSEDELTSIVECIKVNKAPGIIATNTTNQHEFDKGGISGELLKEKAYQTVKFIQSLNSDNSFDLIACGGISSVQDIKRYEELNIHFFQVYSAFVYQGPSVLTKLLS